MTVRRSKAELLILTSMCLAELRSWLAKLKLISNQRRQIWLSSAGKIVALLSLDKWF